MLRPALVLLLLLTACGGAPRSNDTEIGGARFPVYPMLEKYKGEEAGGGHYGTVIRYLDQAERAEHVLVVKEGLLYDSRGRRLDPQVDESGNEERSGFAIYVMTGDGTVYVSFDHKQGSFHHSSLVGGAPTACAGDMTVVEGELLELSNSSGHYRPPAKCLDAVSTVLTEKGLDMSKVTITRVGEADR